MAFEAKGAMLGALDDTDNNGAYDSNASEYFDLDNLDCPGSEKADSAKPFSMTNSAESDVCVPPGSAVLKWMRAHHLHRPVFLRRQWWRRQAKWWRRQAKQFADADSSATACATRDRKAVQALLASGAEVAQMRKAYLSNLGIQRGQPCGATGRAASLQYQFCSLAEDQGYVDLLSLATEEHFLARKSQHRARLLQKVLVPVALKPRVNQTLFVFDWDDTLFPTGAVVACLTSAFASLPLKKHLPASLRKALESLEVVVKDLLEKAMTLGTVIIITNALDGWVQNTAQQYMPSLVPTLEKMRVISARSKYECDFPGHQAKWKARTFVDVHRELDPGMLMNMIAIGDAEHEIRAAHALRLEEKPCVIKTVKFCPNPSPQYLLFQLKYVRKQIMKLVIEPRHKALSLPGVQHGEA